MRKLTTSFLTLVLLGSICAAQEWSVWGTKKSGWQLIKDAACGQDFRSARNRGSTARLISSSPSAYSNTVVR